MSQVIVNKHQVSEAHAKGCIHCPMPSLQPPPRADGCARGEEREMVWLSAVGERFLSVCLIARAGTPF